MQIRDLSSTGSTYVVILRLASVPDAAASPLAGE
jgi:hypothetical protein